METIARPEILIIEEGAIPTGLVQTQVEELTLGTQQAHLV
jgi:hypothetical protein